MSNDNISEPSARKALSKLQTTQQSILETYRPSGIISLLMSISYGFIILGYGLTEHNNDWALAIWLGALGFILFTGLHIYSYRLKGIKIGIFPRSSQSGLMHLYAGILFAVLAFCSRLLRTEFSLEFSPYLCAILASVLFYWLNRKYPTGESGIKGA